MKLTEKYEKSTESDKKAGKTVISDDFYSILDGMEQLIDKLENLRLR